MVGECWRVGLPEPDGERGVGRQDGGTVGVGRYGWRREESGSVEV